MKSGATPNILSPQSVGKHLLHGTEPRKVVKVANVDRSDVLKKVMDVPVLFEELKSSSDFPVFQDVIFTTVIVRLTFRRL